MPKSGSFVVSCWCCSAPLGARRFVNRTATLTIGAVRLRERVILECLSCGEKLLFEPPDLLPMRELLGPGSDTATGHEVYSHIVRRPRRQDAGDDDSDSE